MQIGASVGGWKPPLLGLRRFLKAKQLTEDGRGAWERRPPRRHELERYSKASRLSSNEKDADRCICRRLETAAPWPSAIFDAMQLTEDGRGAWERRRPRRHELEPYSKASRLGSNVKDADRCICRRLETAA